MALFKVYHGNPLPGQLKDSYGYIIVNEEASAGTWIDDQNQEHDYGIGEWYIDTDTKRYRIAAAELIDEEGNLYTFDDFVQKENIVDDLASAVYDSSSQQSIVPLNIREELRIGIDVAKSEDSITKAFTITLPFSNWPNAVGKTGYSQKQISLNEALHCGEIGADIPVSPLIMWNDGPKAFYDALDSVELNDDKDKLIFYMKNSDAATRTADLGITVIDHR